MKTKEAIEKAGSVKALAELLQIKQAAVYQWSEMVPHRRVLELRLLKPEWFQSEKSKREFEILKPRQSIVIGAKQKPGLKMAQI
jgi:hypothetical protein